MGNDPSNYWDLLGLLADEEGIRYHDFWHRGQWRVDPNNPATCVDGKMMMNEVAYYWNSWSMSGWYDKSQKRQRKPKHWDHVGYEKSDDDECCYQRSQAGKNLDSLAESVSEATKTQALLGRDILVEGISSFIVIDKLLKLTKFKKLDKVTDTPKSGLGNPFKDKTPQQIDEMFKKKGFEPRGPDPVNGKGGYVNPKNQRSYHIDEANSFGEPPHVDINRLDKKGPLPKKKLPMQPSSGGN